MDSYPATPTPPLAAALLCTYQQDRPEWLAEALDSMLQQTYASSAVRIYLGVDGPLPAALLEVINARRARIYKISSTEQRQGLARCLNRLIGLLEDEVYVFRMDADDVCLPDRFARQVSYLESHPEIAILGTAIQEMDAAGRALRVRTYPKAHSVRATIAKASPLAHPTVCMRTEALRALGGYPIEGTNEDIALWFNACRKGYRIDNLPAALLRYRLTSATYARRGAEKAWGELKVYVKGIWGLYGPTWRLVFPLLRYLLRLMPSQVTHLAYRSTGLRNWLTRTGRLAEGESAGPKS